MQKTQVNVLEQLNLILWLNFHSTKSMYAIKFNSAWTYFENTPQDYPSLSFHRGSDKVPIAEDLFHFDLKV